MYKCRKDIRGTDAQAARGHVCLAAAALGLLLFCSSAQAAEIPLLTGATGPTGPTGPEGKTGPTGPTGAGGSGGSGEATSVGTLESGKSETGAWTATISAAKGAPQVQADGVVSFPIKMKEYEVQDGIKYKYRDAEEALKPERPCVGSVDEPIAEKGFLCVYRGGALNGAKENEDKNVTDKPGEVFFVSLFGEKLLEQTGVSGQDGLRIVFRTKQFNATGTGEPATLTETSYLDAGGSWAVTAK